MAAAQDVAQSNTFGRRAAHSPAPATAPVRPRRTPTDSLDARAEAFRAEIAANRRPSSSTFQQWRRSQSHRVWLARGLTLLSFSPGLVSFVLDAPIELSIGLEIAAVVANVWIRRERFRRSREIVAWEDPAVD
jgi:hypothetical protein